MSLSVTPASAYTNWEQRVHAKVLNVELSRANIATVGLECEVRVVTPGIRPSGSQAGDQKRVATPTEAIINGSDFLVVGRPIVQSDNPLKAAKEILKEIQEAQVKTNRV